MNKALTEKESKVADLFLEDLLTHEKTHAFKSVVNHFFEKYKISKEIKITVDADYRHAH